MKKFSTFLVSVCIAMMLMTSIADAKSGSSHSSGSRSSSSRSSSFGGRSSSSFSSGRSISIKPSSSSSSPARSTSSGSWFGSSKPSSTTSSYNSSKPAPIKVTRDNVIGSLKGKGAKGDAAGVLYKDFQTRKANPINPSTKLDKAQMDKVFSPTYRSNRRSDYYGGYKPTPSQHYRETVYVNHSNGYGIWDLLLFESIMDNVGDRQMYYHHQSDPAFQSWRTDANAACAAGDKDVCEKLADLDKEMADYKAKGVKQNPNYVTPGVDPDIYEANNIDPKTLTEIKICTGAVGSDYSSYVGDITRVTKLKVKSISTNGSADNIAKLASGECDMAFVQDDLISTSGLIKVVTPNQLEAGMLICNKDSNIKTIADIDDKTTIFVGSDQTGSQFTLENLRKLIPSLGKAQIVNNIATMQAVSILPSSRLPTTELSSKRCLFAVSTPDYTGFKELDKNTTTKFQAVPLFSKDFTDKSHGGYKLVNVDVSHYKTLTQDEYKSFGWGHPGGTDTIGISTSLVAPQNWIDQNKQLYDLLMLERQNLQVSLH